MGCNRDEKHFFLENAWKQLIVHWRLVRIVIIIIYIIIIIIINYTLLCFLAFLIL